MALSKAVERVTAEVVDAPAEMAADEARRITDGIKAHLWDAGRLIVDAYDRGAHRALGYTSWHAYVEEEFGITDREARNVLARERLRLRLTQACGGNAFPLQQCVGSTLSIRKSQALSAALPAIEERIAAGEDAAVVIEEYLPEPKSRNRTPHPEVERDEPQLDRRQAADHRDEVSMDFTLYHSAPSSRERERAGLPYFREDEPTFWPVRGAVLPGVRSPRGPEDVVRIAKAVHDTLLRLALGTNGQQPPKPIDGVDIPGGFNMQVR